MPLQGPKKDMGPKKQDMGPKKQEQPQQPPKKMEEVYSSIGLSRWSHLPDQGCLLTVSQLCDLSSAQPPFECDAAWACW